MKLVERMKSGFTISGLAHAAVLLWALVSFAVKPFASDPADSMPVDIISLSDFSQMTAGSKTAPKKEAAKPLVEKVAEPKPAEDVTAKVAEKQEVQTASAPAAAEPPVETKVPEPKPKPTPPEAKAEPKKEPEKPDAEALKKDEAKKPEPKKEEAKPLPPKKPEPKKEVVEKKPQQEQPKFDAHRIAALLDKRQPQRVAAAGDTLNNTPSLGTTTGKAAALSQNEIDALRARIQQCWNPPAGAADAKDLIVAVRILFKLDGSLAARPTVTSRGNGVYAQAASESALRAIERCAPYSFLPAAKYDAWKDVEVTFDPRDMFRG